MGCYSFRSLLLAAIVISNCITWTASRHSFRHNVSGHRRRHRRQQGDGLAVPSHYVLPGGEGSAAGWSQWMTPSNCSRPCGGGVKSQQRVCNLIGSDGKPQCIGGDTMYYSCNLQDCPESAQDFRAQQCAEYNDVTFKNRTYNWVPYTNGPRPCELNCMPKGERFYYRHKARVTDGTRCNDETNDVCVAGECQPMGCDMILGSNAREDKCRECRGNGTNCDTIASIYDNQDLMQGYNDILLIPEGATNILIEELDKSNNYLALRSFDDNEYYLNGGYQISFPHTLQIAGAPWHYERSIQGFAAPDKLRCLGPTTEPLYLSLLQQETNVGIRYEYSIRKGLMPQTNALYVWAQEEFTPCSVTCGTGFRTRNVTCRIRDSLEAADDNLCDAVLRPITNETCQLAECLPQWMPSPWGPCSKLCGEGSQSRTVQCQKIISNGYPSIVDEDQCFRRLGDKPAEHQKCNTNATCPTWFTGPWKPCDKLCGDGKQTRQVVCHRKTDGRVEVLVDENCEEEKPAAEQPCNIHPCEGIDWVFSNWTGCDSCLSINYTREALCVTKDRQVVAKEQCAYHHEPKLGTPCNDSKLPACESQWYASQWSECSVDCGVGVKTRIVFCGTLIENQVEVLDDSKCDATEKYNNTTPCAVPDELCPAKWFTSDWSECTKVCDGGKQFRKVMCLSGGNASGSCPDSLMPDEEQPCNQKACNIDELISMSSTPVMDDYDDLPLCEEEDEVGAERTSTTLGDTMVSDSASTPEGSGATEAEFDLLAFTGTGTGADFTESGSGESESTTDSSASSTTASETTSSDLTKGTGSTSIEETSTPLSTVTESGAASTTAGTGSTDSGTGSSTAATGDTSSGSTVDKDESTTGSSHATASESESSSGVTEASTSEAGSTSKTGSTSEPGSTSGPGSTSEPGSTVTGETGSSGASDSTEPASSESRSIPSGPTVTDSSAPGETTTSGLSETTDPDTNSTTDSTVSTPTETTDPSSDTTTDSTTGTPTTVSTTDSSDTTTDFTLSTVKDTEKTKAGDKPLMPLPETTPSASTTLSSGALCLLPTETGTCSGGQLRWTYAPDLLECILFNYTGCGGNANNFPTKEHCEIVCGAPEDDSTTSPLLTTESSTPTSDGSTPTSDGSTPTSDGSTPTWDGSKPTSDGSTPTSNGSTPTSDGSTPTSDGSTPTSDGLTPTSDGSTPTSDGSTTTSDGSTPTSDGSTPTSDGLTPTTDGSTPTSDGSTPTSGSTTEAGTGATSTPASESSTTSGTGTTTEGGSTTDDGLDTSPWSTSSVFATTKRQCRPRNAPAKCRSSTFGCCPDKKTAAGGPFDGGCPNLTTCMDTKYGCCPDGVSPAGGSNNEDCPVPKCEETLYGCCASDKKTPAEGNDQEGCPPPCKASRYGCCADNETFSTGPHGCPETAITTTEPTTESTTESASTAESLSTEFTSTESTTEPVTSGLCSTVNGTEVCEPCSELEHGCCDDGKTPAHGPDKLGCCLLSPYGCCPDNYQAAIGPNGEGCSCIISKFGCCPDNKSYARGANYSGCGCEYSAHGCCPDRHTEATGDGFEGCSCHTYQYGCCPDGETAAEGPNQQGCGCQGRNCCSDGVTVAEGPNQEGCDCSTSKFGCCLDGVTPAQNNTFGGCPSAPVNKQAACEKPYNPGLNCKPYTIQWHYDMSYGGCSRFFYGGCGGNDNRFADKAECEAVCVEPDGKDVCQLPQVVGTCTEQHRRWYYDSKQQRCKQFNYGGCLGNKNNFITLEECETRCSAELTQEQQCQQALEPGPCNGSFARWGFDRAARECRPFPWGGCLGNSNRFISKAACDLQCGVPPGEKQPECQLAQDTGNCTHKIPYWSFNTTENRCVPIHYSGCGGNNNRFTNRTDCEASCPSSYVKDKCTLPVNFGECRRSENRWFYDTKYQQCRQFTYGGCNGNANNFYSEQQCRSECTVAKPPPPPPTRPTITETPALCLLPTETGTCSGGQLRWTYAPDLLECILFNYTGCGGNANNFPTKEHCEIVCGAPEDICTQPKAVGPCNAPHPRYYFNAETQRCEQFLFGGCRGNRNNFETEDKCRSQCIKPTTTPIPEPPKDICSLPPEVGPCHSALRRWYYDAAAGRCASFIYGGCKANENNFLSARACEIRCAPATPPPIAPECLVGDIGQCRGFGRVWYLDPGAGRCAPYDSAAGAPACAVPGVFPSPEACERSCGEFRELGDIGQCRGFGRVWYLDPGAGRCAPYDSAAGAPACAVPGVFPSPEACERSCGEFRELGDVCRFNKEEGSCRDRQIKYYYDNASKSCKSFTYTGCYGSPNRFSTFAECASVCMPDPCKMPVALGNCTDEIDSWFYDEAAEQCGQFIYTGCNGNANNFKSRGECEVQCKTGVMPPARPTERTLSTEWCKLPVQAGNCDQFQAKWYYDEAKDSCAQFLYTGCNGNNNRFDSQKECEGLCKSAVENQNELLEEQCRLPVSLQPCGATQYTFYYDFNENSCIKAPIAGCTHIPNRYRTQEECLRTCGDFRGKQVCHERLDPGPCRDTQETKYYWNLSQGRCESFTYGGCGGGANRFSTAEECFEVCGNLTIDPACGLPPAPGAPCAGAGPARGGTRWHRSTLYGDCRPFVFYGCEGNGNNFASKEECERHCSPPEPGEGNEIECEEARRECSALRCQYGITYTKDPGDDCDRCSCDPNPCADMQCGPGQSCHIVPYRAGNTDDVKYTSQCRSDCSSERARCATLQQQCAVQRTRGPDNCERCECIRPEVNCQPFEDECLTLQCNYGPITRTRDADGCERCTCLAHPCEGKQCPEGQRCVVTADRNPLNGDVQYSGNCGTVNKPGSCPAEQASSSSCHVECNDDADCRGVQKCCASGCSRLCRAPAPDRPTQVYPEPPSAPQPDPATEKVVSSSERGTATLRCVFTSNPPVHISWKKDEITIDGKQGRYRLTSDGALQIVSLYRNDSGVYICIGENELGSSQQEVELRVDGPVSAPAGIVEESDSDMVGEIGSPLRIRCLAYGFPEPDIRWFRGQDMVPFVSAEYEARGPLLLIKALSVDTLGEYTCQAFNGQGRPVSWTVTVRAERPGSSRGDSPFWLQRAPAPRVERPRADDSSQQIVLFPPAPPREFTVRVKTSIRGTPTALATGGRLDLVCDVDGYPEPRVYWTKDNQRLSETSTLLSVSPLAETDAGEYGCHADNGYSNHHSTVQITVQKLYIPELCKDNQYFADCKLIVRSNLCHHEYYSKFCCKSCVEAGELNPSDLEFQADQSWTFKKK